MSNDDNNSNNSRSNNQDDDSAGEDRIIAVREDCIIADPNEVSVLFNFDIVLSLNSKLLH